VLVLLILLFFFFFHAEDGIRDFHVTGVQTCALPICPYTFFGNTPAIADEVNANFDVLFNLVNGQIDGANLAPVTINDSLKPTSQTASVWLVLSWLANQTLIGRAHV